MKPYFVVMFRWYGWAPGVWYQWRKRNFPRHEVAVRTADKHFVSQQPTFKWKVEARP